MRKGKLLRAVFELRRERNDFAVKKNRLAVAGEFETIVSAALLAELDGVLRREKFRPHLDLETAGEYVALLRRTTTNAADPEQPPPLRSTDPDDDYLIALAHSQNAVLVSGDSDLLDLAGGAPICAPADFLATVA